MFDRWLDALQNRDCDRQAATYTKNIRRTWTNEIRNVTVNLQGQTQAELKTGRPANNCQLSSEGPMAQHTQPLTWACQAGVQRLAWQTKR